MSWDGLNLNKSILDDEEDDYCEIDNGWAEWGDDVSSHKYDNEQLLIEAAKELMGISNDDMEDPDTIKVKIRDFKINNILK